MITIPIFACHLSSSEVEMMIGGLMENSESRALLTPSIKYYQDDMTFCVAKALLAPSWMNVFAIFNSTIWLVVFLFLLSSSYLMWRLSKFDMDSEGNFFWGFLQALALTLNTYATYVPNKLFIRLFYLCLTFYGIHFNTAYQSFLIGVITRPRYQMQVSSIGMALQQGFHFKGSENSYNYFRNLQTSTATTIADNFEICDDIDKCLQEIANDLTLAVAVSREHSENSPLMKKTNMFCFTRTNNINNYLVSILARRDHHLLSRMNRNIRGILEAGLLNKWQADSQRESDLSSVSIVTEEDSGQIVLKVQHVQGAFYVLIVGLFVAFVIYLLELLSYKLSRFERFRWLRCMENVFCFNNSQAMYRKL